MKHKLNGAGVSHTDQHSSAKLRMLMNDAEPAPMIEEIHWTQSAHERSAAARKARIAEVAYYMAESRGFAPGHDAEDWLVAQAEVDAEDASSFES
jgi:hypothetical protein